MAGDGGERSKHSTVLGAVGTGGSQLLAPPCNPNGGVLNLSRKTAEPRSGAIYKTYDQRLDPAGIIYVLNQTIPEARLAHGPFIM